MHKINVIFFKFLKTSTDWALLITKGIKERRRKPRSLLVLNLEEGISRRALFEDLRDLTFGFACIGLISTVGQARSCNALYVIKRILKSILDLRVTMKCSQDRCYVSSAVGVRKNSGGVLYGGGAQGRLDRVHNSNQDGTRQKHVWFFPGLEWWVLV